jgi:hypothetical protein
LLPVRALITCIHEGGHALAVYLTGGVFLGADLSLAGDSFVLSSGGLEAVVLAAGYTAVFCWAGLLLRACQALKKKTGLTAVFSASCLGVVLILPASTAYLAPWVLGVLLASLTVQPTTFRLLGEWTAYAVVCTSLVGMIGDMRSSEHADAHQLAASLGVSPVMVTLGWSLTAVVILVWAYWSPNPQAETISR